MHALNLDGTKDFCAYARQPVNMPPLTTPRIVDQNFTTFIADLWTHSHILISTSPHDILGVLKDGSLPSDIHRRAHDHCYIRLLCIVSRRYLDAFSIECFHLTCRHVPPFRCQHCSAQLCRSFSSLKCTVHASRPRQIHTCTFKKKDAHAHPIFPSTKHHLSPTSVSW